MASYGSLFTTILQNNMDKTPKTDAEVAAPHFQHPQSQSQQPSYGQVFSQNENFDGLNQQIQELTRRLDALDVKRINWNTDIIGLVETVTAAPTIQPKSPFDQIKIAVISGTSYLYIYNATNRVWLRTVLA